ncbi:MAG: hypothetical protein QOI47_1432 [Actinomycetota bacterium]|nr:hypothetical protein [Actinomycetota bacterium]
MSTPPLVADPELVTAEWLTDVLRHSDAIGEGTKVASFEHHSIGTGQVGDNVRYTLTYQGEPGPASIVCKFSSRDPQTAAAGVQTRTYDTEIAFYRDLAHTVDISRPRCHLAALEPGTANVVLVMEDLAPAEQGDQIEGCTVKQATLAVDEAAKLHGPRWGDPTLGELAWLDRSATSGGMMLMLGVIWEGFVDRYRATLDPVTIDVGDELVASIDKLRAHEPPVKTVVHGDYRLDNILFGTEAGGRPLTVVDWQTVQLGLGPADVAYFLGNAFSPEVRRACERDLVARYHDALLGYDVRGYSFDQCWNDYRRSSYSSLIMAIVASMLVGRTDRGDTMFMAMANRSAAMANDLDAAAFLA